MIRNIHERVINAPLEPLGILLDALGQKDDRLWPSRHWPPMGRRGTCPSYPNT